MFVRFPRFCDSFCLCFHSCFQEKQFGHELQYFCLRYLKILSEFSTVLRGIMPSSRKRGNQQRNNELPAPRGRPPKRRAATSQKRNQHEDNLAVSSEVSSVDNNPQSRDNLPSFSADQLETLRTMIQDTVAKSSRDIATEAAHAAVTALLNQNSVAVGTTLQSDTNPLGATNQPRHTTSLGDPNPLCYNAESPQLPASSVPNQDIPASYVKDIQSGEFFDLSKLLPKNLSMYDEDDNLTLTLDNSAIKVTKKRKSSPSQITEIEQWTTAFTTYMSVFTCKYPLRAQEFLQYLSLIRYAARVHKGLGWAIYDHKFRQKASLDKSLFWSQIDQHLWLTIFTVSPLALKEEYPLFNNGPQSNASKGDVRGFCHQYNGVGVCRRDQCEYQHICNICKGQHPGRDCSRDCTRGGYVRDRDKRTSARAREEVHPPPKSSSSSGHHKS